MAEISIGAAVGAGFDLIGRKPLTVLTWGLLRIAFVAVIFAIFAQVYVDVFGEVIRQARTHAATPPDLSAIMPRMMMAQGLSYLMQLLGLLLSSVLYCAAFRSVIHPDQGRFAYLRIGAAEFFVAVLSFAVGIVVVLGLLLLMLPFGLIIGILAAIHLGVVAVIVGVVGAFCLIVGVIYAAVRFALVGPMIVQDGKFHLFESWAMTRGKAGSLFLVGLSLVGIGLVAEIVIGGLAIALGAAALGMAAGGFSALPAFFTQAPSVIIAKLAPFVAVYGLAAIPLTGCSLAILAAPWARAYLDLAPDASEAFA